MPPQGRGAKMPTASRATRHAERDGAAGRRCSRSTHGDGRVLETGTEAQGHATSLGDATAYPGRVANALAAAR